MHIELQQVAPAQIEARSMEIIRSELKRSLPPEQEAVILRAIHTTADFDYAENLCVSPDAVQRGVEALRGGADIVTDTTMAMSGINKRVLAKFGGQVYNFIADGDVAAEAKDRGITRAAVSMERAACLDGPVLAAVGNAPTALIKLHELIASDRFRPAFLVAVPVVFVNVVESKEMFMELDTPYIVAKGRKGGSNVAAAIVNALMLEALKA